MVFCWLERLGWRRSLDILHPIPGVVLLLVLTVPWWWALHHRLGGEALQNTQLAGTLLRIQWDQAFNLYYLYRPLQLILPWVLFIPATLRLLQRTLHTAGVNRLEPWTTTALLLHAASAAYHVLINGGW